MTKKNYIRVARILKGVPKTKESLKIKAELMGYFKEDKNLVNADRFDMACI